MTAKKTRVTGPEKTEYKPPSRSVITVDSGADVDGPAGQDMTGRYRGVVTTDGTRVHEGESWFEDEQDAREQAVAWCRRRGIQFDQG